MRPYVIQRLSHFMPLFAMAVFAAPSSSASTCSNLSTLQLPETTITAAESVSAGPFASANGPVTIAAEFCRVAMVVKPSDDSDIHVEIWLPVAGWNGKFQGIGNGGFAGSIDFAALAAAIANGYAAASTDSGHHAGGTDAAWALNHPEKIADFAYRAIHETAARGKAIAYAFYGEAPKHSYFSSCSNGGRQALMEAERYPADYDGIIAGAPAYYWTHLLTTSIYNLQAVSEPDSAIAASKLPAIEGAALAACDALDGVKDGVIEDPAQCRFDPSVLLCKDAESDACLTAPQLAALQKIYGGSKTSKGESIMPGFSPGGEAEQGGWASWITGSGQRPSLQYAFGTNFFKYMVYNDAAWDFKTSTTDHNVKLADDKLALILNATNPDLKKFERGGGKLILYHGWSDAAIPPQSTVEYYQSVVKKMGAKEAARFVRLFMVPGMGHCGGGAGPDVFGISGVSRTDAEHDINAALERWVEQGVAPEQVIATKIKRGTTPAVTERTRPLCAYPQTAHWKGSGSTDDAANFVCK